MLEGVLFFFAMLVLFPATGFLVSLAFFPKKELGLFERIVFSFALGIILPAILLLFENQVFSIPLDFFSAIATIALIAAASLCVFCLRKSKK